MASFLLRRMPKPTRRVLRHAAVLLFVVVVAVPVWAFVSPRSFLRAPVPAVAEMRHADAVVGDIKVEQCYRWRCPVPYGWTRIPKDLELGALWFTHTYVYVEDTVLIPLNKDRAVVVVDMETMLPTDRVLSDGRQYPARVLEDSGVDLTKKHAKQVVAMVTARGWMRRGHGIWVRFGTIQDEVVKSVSVLFGNGAVEVRSGWHMLEVPLLGVHSLLAVHLTLEQGPKLAPPVPRLTTTTNGWFKVLQVADLHFSTGDGVCMDPEPALLGVGCKADPRLLAFLDKMLELEQPDLVVMTGDQVFGQQAPDLETALFKAVFPLIERQIPYAMVLGNHDHEGLLNRQQMMELALLLPYSLLQVGPSDVDGFGNYVLTVEGKRGLGVGTNTQPVLTLYFLDSHAYSLNPKVNPGYDFVKESQVNFLRDQSVEVQLRLRNGNTPHVQMLFQHIPIPEYRGHGQALVGLHKEGVTAPRSDAGVRKAMLELGILVASVGHDHCNDYCLRDTFQEHTAWLCFGGGAGEGGYGGYGGTQRRMRVFQLNLVQGTVKTWKRGENDPSVAFDEQLVVAMGHAGDAPPAKEPPAKKPPAKEPVV